MENWYAIYLKPGCERLVSGRLESAGVPTLNPLLRSRRFRGRRVIENISPLFPCYIFARFDPAARYRMIIYTRGVRYVVGGTSPLPVPEEIIEAIRGKMADGVIELPPEDFTEGRQVLIKDGPFKGFNGIFRRYTNGRQRCLVLLESLAWTLEADPWLVESA
ncbi:MAG: hypothetical protein M0033_11890 [Nitrospiraceae bacterium]|nr:hypothetical protein [Nitrospiraceae bacterium]MDA8326903.1 hypothetical protein [Nitrospiraceae bacterium]